METSNQNETVHEKVKKVEITINGEKFIVEKGEMTYEEIVTLAFPDFPQHPERTYSVKYKKGHGHKPEGILTPGESVKIKDEMIFHVKHTGQS